MKHVVIVGTQHGGAWIAAKIKKRLRKGVHVSLVVTSPAVSILPILTYGLGHDSVDGVQVLRDELQHLEVDLIVSRVHEHDSKSKALYLDHGKLEYDVLVYDVAVEPDFSVSGSAEYSFPLEDLKSINGLKGHIEAQLRRAHFVREGEQAQHTTFVISRGDVQGVEAAFALAHKLREVRETTKIILCSDGLKGSLLAVEELTKILEEAGVEIHAGYVQQVLPNHVILGGVTPRKIRTNTVLWTGHWKQTHQPITQGTGVHELTTLNPYWPSTGYGIAKDAVDWVSAFLSGKPRPPNNREKKMLVRTPKKVIHVGEGISQHPLHKVSHAWRQKQGLDL